MTIAKEAKKLIEGMLALYTLSNQQGFRIKAWKLTELEFFLITGRSAEEWNLPHIYGIPIKIKL